MSNGVLCENVALACGRCLRGSIDVDKFVRAAASVGVSRVRRNAPEVMGNLRRSVGPAALNA